MNVEATGRAALVVDNVASRTGASLAAMWRGSSTATLLATHVHRDDDPGAGLQIGGRLTGEAARGDTGWRLHCLELDLVWTDGDPPGRVAG